jgi:hypothetical protein
MPLRRRGCSPERSDRSQLLKDLGRENRTLAVSVQLRRGQFPGFFFFNSAQMIRQQYPTGTGTEVEVDYQPPRGNRLEEKDRFPTEVRLDKSITNEQRFQALADPNSRTEGFTAPGEHSSLDLLYDTFCSRCQ